MIPREYLRKIRQIELRTSRLAQETLAGAYHSVFKGRGIDFEEVRVYQPGDEVKTIDWNVTARTGVPHVRRYREERELSVVIALDVSASGSLGSGEQTKRELAAEIASVLAFSALKNNDRVGLVLFSDEVELYVAPGKGRAHVFRIIREILFFAPKKPGTSLAAALNFVNQMFRRRAVVAVISDFLDEDFEPALKVASVRHDLIALTIFDPRERTLPAAGWVMLEDAETGEILEVNTNDPEVRARFERLARHRSEQLKKTLSRTKTDHVEIPTSSAYHLTLRSFFDRRARARG
ncbi:MAG TPA: DUF58 domain-containing protein [Chthoniobacterales bacterium]